MRKNSKKILAMFFSMTMTMTAFLLAFAQPVRAEAYGKKSAPDKRKYLLKSTGSEEDDNKKGVHADPATFRKNFTLSFDQKEYTITECEKVVKNIIRPEMSDLEKYYTLAIWVNKRVEYDWSFWKDGYNFDYYSHQWDAYGGMKEDEKSVCVGIAIFYSNMCHAAGLPCRFVRLKPEYLDHTIDYIPDINGKAYYTDVTENVFLNSEFSDDAFPDVDKEFGKITQDCTDTTFDFRTDPDNELQSINIKDCYDMTYEEWFNEYALHKNTDKIFDTDYVEKGSGESGKHRASYYDFPSNFTDSPDIWFLDDFYNDPGETKTKILNKEFDEQLVNVSGIKKTYDCGTKDELEAAIARDITVKYFPSAENGEVVAKTAVLVKDTDYKITYAGYDDATNTAEFTVVGIGEYSGTYPVNVKMNSAVVVKPPKARVGLVYNEKPQDLIESGQAECGEMQYALGTKTEPTGSFSREIPKATDAGKYYVWYKAAGDANHKPSDPQRMERAISIAAVSLNIILRDMTIKVGETAKIVPEPTRKVPLTYTFQNTNKSVVSVTEDGEVTGKSPGDATVIVKCQLKYSTPNYLLPYRSVAFITVEDNKDNKATEPDKPNESGKVSKSANPMTLKGKKVVIRYRSLKKKPKAIKRAKLFKVNNAQGKLSYKLVKVKKGKKIVKKKFKISAKTGKLIVKKRLPKGTYKLKVKVKAAGNAYYKASGWKSVKFIIIVK